MGLFIFIFSCQLFLLAGIILCTHLYVNCRAHANRVGEGIACGSWKDPYGAYGIYKLWHQTFPSLRESV